VALAADASEPLQGPLEAITLLIGSERDGLPEEIVAACERSARIPIASHSLNAAMAATVALYEMTIRSRPPGRDHDTVPAS
jgi:TrmH family RNA methyltransferase